METQPPLKRCPKCGQKKPTTEFGRKRSTCDGLNPWCLLCARESCKAWAKENPRAILSANRRRLYGIRDQQHFDEMVAAQSGKCRICKRDFNSLGKEPHVDHDHVFGVVRGILCSKCNHLVGHIEKNRHLLEEALDYILESDNPVVGGGQ